MTVALMPFPSALNARVGIVGKFSRDSMDCKRAHSRTVMYRFSQAIIGTWVVVIAINDGAVVGRFTRTPEAELYDVLQMSRSSPLQFHSNF